MKIKNYPTKLLLLAGLLFARPVFAQSTITALLKTKPVAQANGVLNEDKLAEIRSYSYTFANGVKLVIRADTNSIIAQMRAIGPGGASIFDDADFQSAIHAAAIIDKSGFGNYSHAEINKFFKQKRITLTPGIDEKYSTLTGTFKAADLEIFLQAIYLYFTQPRKDKAAFNHYIKDLTADAELRSKNPLNILQDTVTELKTGNKNRVSIISAANLKKINLDKAYNIYRRCFGNARGFTFAITGNFEADEMNAPEKIIDLLTQYIGSLPSTTDTTTIADRNTTIPPGKIYRKIYNGHDALAGVQIVYSGAYHYTDSVNLQLKVLSYLIEKRLNAFKTFSGANKASVKLNLDKFPEETYAVNIAFKSPPSQVERMVKIVNETVTGLQHRVQPQEIKEYVAIKKDQLKKQIYHDDLFWPDYLVWQFVNKADPEEISQYPYNFHKADEHTVQQAANQFLTGSNYLNAIVLPKKTSARIKPKITYRKQPILN